MEKHDIRIRVATEDDAAALLAIYAPYVIKTAITFEYEVPTLEEFRGRIRHTLQKYPYLVAEQDGTILGYAYVGPFHDRAAYDWAVETSIYVEENLRRCGVGGKLNRALETVCGAMGILNMEACIGVPEEEDEYLTRNSENTMHISGIVWSVNFISAVTNSDAGIIWSGWKRSSGSIKMRCRHRSGFRSFPACRRFWITCNRKSLNGGLASDASDVLKQ